MTIFICFVHKKTFVTDVARLTSEARHMICSAAVAFTFLAFVDVKQDLIRYRPPQCFLRSALQSLLFFRIAKRDSNRPIFVRRRRSVSNPNEPFAAFDRCAFSLSSAILAASSTTFSSSLSGTSFAFLDHFFLRRLCN